MRNVVSIDWVSCTVKKISPQEVIENILLMSVDDFSIEDWGINRYNMHYSCGDIKVFFKIKQGQPDLINMGVFVLLSGQGAQQYSEFFDSNKNNWCELFKRFMNCDANVTRVDIAHDIFNGLLCVRVLQDYIKKGLCISQAKTSRYYEDNILETGEVIGETVEIGKKGNNNIQLCVYNKLMEQYSIGNIKKIEGIDNWVRSEMRYFGQRANKVALRIAEHEPLKKIFFSTIAGFVRFIAPENKHKKDSNRWRRPLVDWWKEYLENEDATKLEVVRKKPTLQRTERWIETAVNRSLAKLMLAWTEAYGAKTAWNMLQKHLESGEEKLTDKDKAEVEQYVREQQNKVLWGQEVID